MLRRVADRRPSGFVEPCRPSKASAPPSGPEWVHEIKHDGFRLLVRRDGPRVRCFTRGGYDWADRFPAIVQAASRLRAQSFLIDGEVIVCRPDGPYRSGPSKTWLKSKNPLSEAVRREREEEWR